MFIYGTNDFGSKRCGNSGCECYCELQSKAGGCKTQVKHSGYRLYKYKSDTTGKSEILRNTNKFLRCWIPIFRIHQTFDRKTFTILLRMAPYSTPGEK